jgi:hypothetical protein
MMTAEWFLKPKSNPLWRITGQTCERDAQQRPHNWESESGRTPSKLHFQHDYIVQDALDLHP